MKMVKILEVGYSEWSGLSFIEDENAHTLERLMEVTRASKQSVIAGLDDLKQKGLINIKYEGKNIKQISLSKKGWIFYSNYC